MGQEKLAIPLRWAWRTMTKCRNRRFAPSAGPNARLIGKPGGLRELTTPALVLDLDAFERNIRAYQDQINLHGLQARPHAKSHKCAEIAHRQIAAGAVGVCTASLHEAEALVGQGINNILITSPVEYSAACRS
jgi:3-hydroxy-D-aspartate aldolase